MKKLEFYLKNLLLKLLLFFNPIEKNSQTPVFNSKSKLLFIRLNRIGDALVITPLLHEIKKAIGCNIYVLADQKNYFVFNNNPSIDEVLIFKKGFKGFISINRIIKEKGIDTVIDLHDDVSTTVSFLIAIAKTKFKFGLKKSNHVIFTNVIERLNPQSNHVIDRILKLSDLFNVQIDHQDVSVRFYPSDRDAKIASDRIKEMNPKNKFLIGINISAGSEARFWGVENYKKLFDAILKFDVRILFFCSPKDLHYALKITAQNNIYPVTDSFGIFSAGILNLNFLITPDTSIVHIASIKKIPVFGLYVKYNTSDMIWSPYRTAFEYIETTEPNLKNISFDQVIKKLEPFLENYINVKRNP